jgi:hypothetical protein
LKSEQEEVNVEYVIHSHKHALEVLETPRCKRLFDEVVDVIASITDDEIVDQFQSMKPSKSLSKAINARLKVRFVEKGWRAESPIFQSQDYQSRKWRLDFAKDRISIEVAFNHGEAISWNLLKPVMASELNHIEKAITTEVGIVICVTGAMKSAGNFDSAVGEFEKFLRYLPPMQAVLPTPILLIGLDAPKAFIVRGGVIGNRNIGAVIPFENP